jgi:hypothetical protein
LGESLLSGGQALLVHRGLLLLLLRCRCLLTRGHGLRVCQPKRGHAGTSLLPLLPGVQVLLVPVCGLFSLLLLALLGTVQALLVHRSPLFLLLLDTGHTLSQFLLGPVQTLLVHGRRLLGFLLLYCPIDPALT